MKDLANCLERLFQNECKTYLCVTPLLEMLFLFVFKDYFVANLAFSRLSVARNCVSHRFVSWNNFFTVWTLHWLQFFFFFLFCFFLVKFFTSYKLCLAFKCFVQYLTLQGSLSFDIIRVDFLDFLCGFASNSFPFLVGLCKSKK